MMQLIGWIILNYMIKGDITNMDFGANKTLVEVIKEGAFGGTYFRDIYSGINRKWYNKSWKGFDELKIID